MRDVWTDFSLWVRILVECEILHCSGGIVGEKHSYSAFEICEMFGISKSTLLRWENEGLLPPVDRDMNNCRQYSRKHIRALSQVIGKRKLGPPYGRSAASENESKLKRPTEEYLVLKPLEGDVAGLYQLAELPEPEASMIHRLLQTALEQYQPHDEAFCEILKVVRRHSCED